jgi:hypothetical protein
MPDVAARKSLRRIAVIGAGQARTLRSDVRRCARRSARGRCARMALGHAAAGARLNGIVLDEIVARLRAGLCLRLAGRLGGLMGALAYLADDGVRSVGTPGVTWAAARAASRIGRRVIAFERGARPRRCGPPPVEA